MIVNVMTEFSYDVYNAVKTIPKGSVASYAQVAVMAGRAGAARAVGNILHKNPWPKDVPCFRVVHADGRLSSAFAFGGLEAQKKMLLLDGIEVINFKVDMNKYQMK